MHPTRRTFPNVTGLRMLLILLLLAFPTTSIAYRQYDAGADGGCVTCHPQFQDRGPLHEAHLTATTTCLLCHRNNPGDNPFTYISGAAGGQGCRGCHGVDNGTPLSWGAGLRAHHANAGVPPDPNGLRCADCHNDPAPLPENTVPVYYTRADVLIDDPCSNDPPASGGENFFGDSRGLDNDGDLLYDGADPDCTPAGIGDDIRGLNPISGLAIVPNPVFRGTTEIVYVLESVSDVILRIFDMQGRMIVEERFPATQPGRHAYSFLARDLAGRTLASGIYTVELAASRQTARGRVILLK